MNPLLDWFEDVAAVIRRSGPSQTSLAVLMPDGSITAFGAGHFLPDVPESLRPELGSGGDGWVSLPVANSDDCVIGCSVGAGEGVVPTLIARVAQIHERDTGEHLVAISRLLSRISQLDAEVQGMTEELVRRYEELNFFFDNEDVVSSSDESERVVRQLLDNCNDALQTQVSALVMRDRSRDTVCIADAACAETVSLRAMLSDPAMTRWVDQLRLPVVINEESERWPNGLTLRGGEKIVACPLFDSGGYHLGALLVINDAEQRDYENSDRNLIAALAEKTARVLSVKYDALTGLLTRESFERCIDTAMTEAQVQQRQHALMHINVDQLKLVNDTFGHDEGDALLRKLAAYIGGQLRAKDKCARLGGDEFGILLPDCELSHARQRAEAIVHGASDIECGQHGRYLDVGISVGVTQIDNSLESVVEQLARADLACLEAKEQGRGRAVVYRQNDRALHAREDQMHWVSRIQRALKENNFDLYAQTIQASAAGNQAPHLELLLRMRAKDGTPLSPGVFLPVAERYHLMPSIDRWVIEHALETLGRHYDPQRHGKAVFAINLAGQSITDEHLLAYLIEQLSQTTFPTAQLCFEITETAAIRNLAAAQEFIGQVKRFGCAFALDDFGAGVSSFANLRALDLDYLKIDGSFVVDMLEDPVSASMVSAINQVGQTMSLATVAEFVSSQEIYTALTELGVTYQQGYFIDEPMPIRLQLERLATRLNGSKSVRNTA